MIVKKRKAVQTVENLIKDLKLSKLVEVKYKERKSYTMFTGFLKDFKNFERTGLSLEMAVGKRNKIITILMNYNQIKTLSIKNI